MPVHIQIRPMTGASCASATASISSTPPGWRYLRPTPGDLPEHRPHRHRICPIRLRNGRFALKRVVREERFSSWSSSVVDYIVDATPLNEKAPGA